MKALLFFFGLFRNRLRPKPGSLWLLRNGSGIVTVVDSSEGAVTKYHFEDFPHAVPSTAFTWQFLGAYALIKNPQPVEAK